MERFLTFIRDHGRDYTAIIQPDEASAHADGAIYVRQQTDTRTASNGTADDAAIRAHFARGTAMYVVARVAPLAR